MWQEARKNEKKIRSLMVDHKKRVERKKDFYERIRRDPVEFLQVHASALRIHIDSAISAAADNCLMPWRGDGSNLIDRFDARAYLEEIPVTDGQAASSSAGKSAASCRGSSSDSPLDSESRINYERWKNLVHYEFSGASENKVLHQILQEEQDVSALVHPQSAYHQQQNHAIKKKVETKKAAIGYNYDSHVPVKKAEESSSSEDSDVEPVRDPLCVDVNDCSADQILKINQIAQKYFIRDDDFVKFMAEDKSEAERIQLAKDIENEKSMFAGRKSRRERKALKERRMLIVRTTSAPQEIQKVPNAVRESESSSSESDQRDKRPVRTEFITSFGGSSDDESEREPANRKLVINKSVPNDRRRDSDEFRSKPADRNGHDRVKSESYDRHRDRHKSSKHQRRSRSRSRERSEKKRRSRSRDRHRDRRRKTRSRSRSRSKNRDRAKHRSRSPSVDAFGRIRRPQRSPSPTPAAKAFPSLPVHVGSPPLPLASEPEVRREPSPPPVRRYYRHDLESGASASDSEEEKGKGCEKPKVGEKEPAVPAARVDNKVRPAGSSSGQAASKIHKILMKKTRAQIESHYRKDKDREMREEKMRTTERRAQDDSRRKSSSHRRRSSSTSS